VSRSWDEMARQSASSPGVHVVTNEDEKSVEGVSVQSLRCIPLPSLNAGAITLRCQKRKEKETEAVLEATLRPFVNAS
jgi:hypothetical protein